MWHFLKKLSPSKVLMKLDIKNAFNSIRRDKILEAVRVHIPQLYHWCSPATQLHLSSFLVKIPYHQEKVYNRVTP